MLSAWASHTSAPPRVAYTGYANGTDPLAASHHTTTSAPPAAVASSEPSDTYRVARITPTNTGAPTRIAGGKITSIVPTLVATPRPPLNPTNTERVEPRMATIAHSTSTAALPVSSRATSTGTTPLSTSPVTTTRARLRPIARSAFVPPVRPLPVRRGSGAPVTLATSNPNGIEPAAYDRRASTTATRTSPAFIAARHLRSAARAVRTPGPESSTGGRQPVDRRERPAARARSTIAPMSRPSHVRRGPGSPGRPETPAEHP